VKQVGEFKNLAPAIKAELPDYFSEKAALEIDFIPAALAGEDIETTELLTENI
jgi:DNA recombination protein RmuC